MPKYKTGDTLVNVYASAGQYLVRMAIRSEETGRDYYILEWTGKRAAGAGEITTAAADRVDRSDGPWGLYVDVPTEPGIYIGSNDLFEQVPFLRDRDGGFWNLTTGQPADPLGAIQSGWTFKPAKNFKGDTYVL